VLTVTAMRWPREVGAIRAVQMHYAVRHPGRVLDVETDVDGIAREYAATDEHPGDPTP
jgi:hypothetical protein